jgi:hypothetical protein
MSKNNKLCKICGKNPATVPDRDRMGSLTKQVCSSCHSLRLIGDLDAIMALRAAQKRERC